MNDSEVTLANPDPLFNVDQAATYLGVSVRFLRQEVAAGHVLVVRLGTRIKIRRSVLEDYVSANTSRSTPGGPE